MMRDVPDGWVEFTAAFIDEVKLGIHAGWSYTNAPSFGGEALVLWPEGASAPSAAYTIRRDRVLGEPVPIVKQTCCAGGPQWGHAWECPKCPD